MSFKFFALIVLFGGIALGLTLQPSQESQPALSTELDQNDWYIEKAQTWQLNADLSQHYLQAEHMRQQEDIIYAQQPRVFISKPEQQIFIRSEQATIINQQHYEFLTQVIVEQRQAQAMDTNRLTTEQLNYNQTTELLTSPLAITLTNAQTITKGVGLRIDLTQQLTQIHSQVTTHYDSQ
jgi:LPS export ABC transporter protein LptC